jgi:GT2 family glycosyltransferase
VTATVAVFLNYRTPSRTIAAVRSLEQSGAPVDAIIVVDNASGDGSPDLLSRNLPQAHLITATANGGFSVGCNLGIRHAQRLGATRILLLNSDVIVPPGAVRALSDALDADARLGIVGPVVVASDDPGVVQSAGISYSRATARMRHLHHGQPLASITRAAVHDVTGVSGCAMLIRSEVLDRIGLLAEEYFFGFEDLDLCLRAHDAGFVIGCARAAEVLHEGSASIGRESPRRIYFTTRNHLLLASRFAACQAAPYRWAQSLAVVMLNAAHVLFTSEVPRKHGLGGLVRGVRDHAAGRYGAGS